MDGSYHFSGRGLTLIQYWRSFEHLEHYARHGANHLKAWRDFNRKIGTGGDVRLLILYRLSWEKNTISMKVAISAAFFI